MSQLDSFREAIRRRVEERANQAINLMGQVRFRAPGPASAGQAVVGIEAFGMEAIALAHTMHQAEAQVLTQVMGFIDEEYRKAMGLPAEQPDPEKVKTIDKQSSERKKGVY